MRLQRKLEISAFAIVIRKDAISAKHLDIDPRDVAWEYLIQRLERFSTLGGTQIWLSHDEGESLLIRRLTRKARRIGSAGSAFGTGSLKRPCRLILDDPVPRNSQESYFIQLADLDAYAAFRKVYAPPGRDTQIVPQDMWDELGTAALARANYLRGGPPGIVSWP